MYVTFEKLFDLQDAIDHFDQVNRRGPKNATERPLKTSSAESMVELTARQMCDSDPQAKLIASQ
jgi:hypothetical protein